MTKSILFCLLAVLAYSSAQRITTIQLDGVQYFISRMNPYSPELNYFLAYQYCRSLGLQLASFETKEKVESMTTYLQNAGYSKYDFWTSGNRLGTGMFLWMSTGLPFNATFDYFENSADAVQAGLLDPTDHNSNTTPQRTARDSSSGLEKACVMLKAPSLKWTPEDCSTIKDFICEQTRCYYYNYGSIPVSSAQGRPITSTTATPRAPIYSTTPIPHLFSSTYASIGRKAANLYRQQQLISSSDSSSTSSSTSSSISSSSSQSHQQHASLKLIHENNKKEERPPVNPLITTVKENLSDINKINSAEQDNSRIISSSQEQDDSSVAVENDLSNASNVSEDEENTDETREQDESSRHLNNSEEGEETLNTEEEEQDNISDKSKSNSSDEEGLAAEAAASDLLKGSSSSSSEDEKQRINNLEHIRVTASSSPSLGETTRIRGSPQPVEIPSVEQRLKQISQEIEKYGSSSHEISSSPDSDIGHQSFLSLSDLIKTLRPNDKKIPQIDSDYSNTMRVLGETTSLVGNDESRKFNSNIQPPSQLNRALF